MIMVYNFADEQQAARALHQIQSDDIPNEAHINDFFWFVTTIVEAIAKNLSVTIRRNTPSGGVCDTIYLIKNAILDYDVANVSCTRLTLDLVLLSDNSSTTETFVFAAEFTEENTMSRPGEHMKYYLYNSNRDIINTFNFNYR